MANEIRGVAASGNTVYARIINPAGLWWNGSTFEAFSAANWATYAVTLTEQGSSGVYVGDFPSGITGGGTYEYFVYVQAGASPAQGDTISNTGRIDWSGTVSISAATGSMSGSEFRDYVLRRGFKRTDKDTELYEAVTDAIQELRRRFEFDEAEVDATTTDTISVLGDYKLDIESDMGFLIGVILQDGTVGAPLTGISKRQFDKLYSSIAVDSNFTGYPEHYCIYAGQIYIGPIPDSVAYTYRLSYSKSAGAITSSSSGVPFTALYRDMLADLTMGILYGGLEEPDKETVFRQKVEAALRDAMRRERKNAGLTHFTMSVVDI